ncbi:hypothetical protein [Cognatilysobacter lacus]|uniref:Uncharacterized protein n=1 Tax=Cognatilysobacter lacus TaxID=1643323 RepID=A0A5D8YMB6_9GAMM|nr:hypothetical protein [Lysobacter lacus]TZF81394.1 hypothetical protein FW784_13640 [Lysobacter lacus]
MATYIIYYIILSGVAGGVARAYIAAGLSAAESIDHPAPAPRWAWRYFVFSSAYAFACLIAPMITTPLWAHLPGHPRRTGFDLLATAVPMALLINWISCRIIRASNR